MKIIGIIDYDENRKAQELIEKKEALNNLVSLLVEDKRYIELHKKCEIDLKLIEDEYNEWWSQIITKYELFDYDLDKIGIDCARRGITYNVIR